MTLKVTGTCCSIILFGHTGTQPYVKHTEKHVGRDDSLQI